MNFQEPWLLAGLPLVALPIIIHLINQRRYQTIRWGAMMFLLAANRMSRGYARIRQWLILAFRVLAIAGLIFAISRPLTSGWLGLAAGGRPDTTIVLIDRSPTMQETRATGGGSKLETGRRQLHETLQTLGSVRWVLIDRATNAPHEFESAQELFQSPSVEPASASADLPAMLQAAHDYVKTNKAGRTEVWICSDLRRNDWDSESGRWPTLREAFRQFPQSVRFHLLAYPQSAAGNVAVRATDVRLHDAGDDPELVLTLRLTRSGGTADRQTVPVRLEIDGARSELIVDMDGAEQELKDHRVPLEASRKRGSGRVSIPADSNPADNEYYFVFDQPAARRAIIVADDPLAARPLELAAAIAPDPAIECAAEFVAEEQLSSVDWKDVSLLIWQGRLPAAESAGLVQAFVDRGGCVLFLPPQAAGDETLFGARWDAWREPIEPVAVDSWRGDQDLLAHTQSGAGLPVGKVQVRRYRGLTGELTQLATLRGGDPLLARAATNRGGVYFCTTTPAPGDSSLAGDGVAFYVLVQRAMAAGAAALGNTRQLTAGEPSSVDVAAWQRLAGDQNALSTEYPYHRGVYLAGERLLAVNRAAAEDQAAALADRTVSDLFQGLDFARVDDEAGSLSSLIQEVWRLFLAAMIVALIVEAALCLPRAVRAAGGPA